MSEFIQKAEYNYLAAKNLINENLFAPSIKCSYYRCVQIMLHYLYDKKGFNDKTFYESRTTSRHGSHAHAIYLTGLDLITKCDRGDYKYFQDKIQVLKALREKSDYKNLPISKDESNDALSISDSLRNILIKTLKL
ncbi:hypothetical protein F0919_17770 [Taibaiella lutea]|uniref:HEPN domain-containing protein n=1 Tax=Taibaiella lutea TaxID=2608001 RepID=A0A5M6CDU2_9BACT|nr:hypothetical protein [Taibaiella lutea]KAA5532630.1 hypothetical protein F0919_17770 [Taibaiella lutea]